MPNIILDTGNLIDDGLIDNCIQQKYFKISSAASSYKKQFITYLGVTSGWTTSVIVYSCGHFNLSFIGIHF